jgi:hypothetical protein
LSAAVAEAVLRLRTWERFPEIEQMVKTAEDIMIHGPIWDNLTDLDCCSKLETLCMNVKNRKELFETKNSRTSILTKRAPLLLGGDVNSDSKGPVYNGVQNTIEWKTLAKKLLQGQIDLLDKHFGCGYWIIPEMFDFGCQLLRSLEYRQRGHADSIAPSLSVVTFVSACASKTSFANRDGKVFDFCEWQDRMILELDKRPSEEVSRAIITLVLELKTVLEALDAVCPSTETALQGETCIFDGRFLHWGNGSEDHPRILVYSTAMPKLLFDDFFNTHFAGVSLRSTLLTSYYSTEFVIDRRTMTNPAFLHNLWMYKSPLVNVKRCPSYDVEKSREKWTAKAESLWEYLSTVAEAAESWPPAVCECCFDNKADSPSALVKCTVSGCWMGSIHVTCMTPAAKKKKYWKCLVCLAGQ